MALLKIKSEIEIPLSELNSFFAHAETIVLDKNHELRLTMACLLAGGHLLIEDIPGVGKTTLVKTFSRLMGLTTNRIQFTNDLLPGDIIGSSIYDPEIKKFVFHQGPIFAEFILADELNRATPKTQSAFLQAMEEHQVSIDGQTQKLPDTFFIIATQNPRQQIGTFSLPESQLDRFLMRISLGYPSRKAERLLLQGDSRQTLLESLPVALPVPVIKNLQAQVSKVHLSDSLLNYVQDLIDATRAQKSAGLSPRGALALVRASRAWALLAGRDIVLPEDVQAVAPSVMSHRLNPSEDYSGETGERLTRDILQSVRVIG